MPELKSYSMSFHGELLQRGFWLYVWDVRTSTERHLYVGRTGDSSSPNAASPFERIGQHLDFRKTAKGNSLARQLKSVAANPSACSFEMLAVGPLFPEQQTFEAHKPFRDRVGALEDALAKRLRDRGYNVIGTPQVRPLSRNFGGKSAVSWTASFLTHGKSNQAVGIRTISQ